MARKLARAAIAQARSAALTLAALLAVGCSGGTETLLQQSTAPVEIWLAPDSPAAAAQARWGLPITCEGFAVVELPLAELQPVCNSPAELAARAPGVTTFGCVRPGACELDLASDVDAATREVVATHELGHLLARNLGHLEGDDCPNGKPGAHLMCAGGPASHEADPTPEDFDFVLGIAP